MPERKESFSESEAEEILRLAVRRADGLGTVSREKLLETAAELGIPEEAVQKAEEEYIALAHEREERAEFDKHTRREFWGHLASYLIVNPALLAMDFFSNGRLEWAYWPVLGWGIGLMFHTWSTFARGSEDYEQEFQKWRERRGLPRRIEHRGVTVGIHMGRRVRHAARDRVRDRLKEKLAALDGLREDGEEETSEIHSRR